MNNIRVLLSLFLSLGVTTGVRGWTEESDLFYGTYSENFITRWGFQEIADFSYDPRTNVYLWPTNPNGVTFDPSRVKAGDILFVRHLDKFFSTLYRKIKVPFIMVTAGEYRDKVEKHQMAYLDDQKIIAWFSVHPGEETHEKFFPIPLGVFQKKKLYENRHTLSRFFSELRKQPKKEMLYLNCGDLMGGKPERALVYKLFRGVNYCYSVQKRLSFTDYMEEMAHFKFTFSLPGYGPDLYRTWEALLVGSIPIVRTSQMDSLFVDLPVVIVHDWNEVTKEFLEQKYREIMTKKWNIEKLFMEFWWKKIKNVRSSFLVRHNEKR